MIRIDEWLLSDSQSWTIWKIIITEKELSSSIKAWPITNEQNGPRGVGLSGTMEVPKSVAEVLRIQRDEWWMIFLLATRRKS